MNTRNVATEAELLYRGIGLTVVRFQQIEQWTAEELAILLRMKDRADQYMVSAAMSYRQKVDLLVELYPRKSTQDPKLPKVDIDVVRRALYAAEEYRNRVVHSFYAVECSEPSRWVRIKGSLRGRSGFSHNTVAINAELFEKCNEALSSIREWSFQTSEALEKATAVLRDSMAKGEI
jgi:hypothetical protein